MARGLGAGTLGSDVRAVLSIFGPKGSERIAWKGPFRPPALSRIPGLSAVKYRSYDDSCAYHVDFIDNDIGQLWHDPLKRLGTMPDVSHEGKRRQQPDALEQPVGYPPGSCWTILRDPIEDTFEIGNRLIVEDQVHRPSRPKALNARAHFIEGEEFAVWIGPTATHFGKLLVGQLDFPHVLDVVEQSTRSGVLLAFGKLHDLPDSLVQ